MKTFQNSYIIRRPKSSELKYFPSFAAKQQWETGINDDRYLNLADPNGSFVGEFQGQIVGIISALAYENFMGHISYFIVDEKHRGKGLGKKLFRAAVKYLDHCNISLDAEKLMLRYYKSQGFQEFFPVFTYKYKLAIAQKSQNILNLKNVSIENILEFQAKVSPFLRPNVLKQYYQGVNSKAIGYVDGGILKGYCALRKCINCYRVAPLYAQSQDVAIQLLNNIGLLLKDQQREIIIAAQANNHKALRLHENLGMTKIYQQIRMYSKQLPNLQYDKIFGIFSTDLG